MLGFADQRTRGLDGGADDKPNWGGLDGSPAEGDVLVAERFVAAYPYGLRSDSRGRAFHSDRVIREHTNGGWQETFRPEGLISNSFR